METIVQISLGLTSIPEALETARLALRAGVDWLEAGTPLISGPKVARAGVALKAPFQSRNLCSPAADVPESGSRRGMISSKANC